MKVTDLFESMPVEAELVLSGKRVILNSEHTLKLFAGDTLLHSFVCSPSALGELCAGWLAAEGYAAEAVEVSPDGQTAKALGVSPAPQKRQLSSRVDASVGEMLALFDQTSGAYARSHGIHECVLKGKNWHVLSIDIGRHNAIDKALGAAILSGYDLTGAVMFTSGRINVQTVQKAARCALGCLMSKAVITREALELARKLGLKVLFSVKESDHISI